MGLDVYQEFVLGVRLRDHVEFGDKLVKQTRYDQYTGEKKTMYTRTNVVTLWDGNSVNEGALWDWLENSPVDFSCATEDEEDIVMGLDLEAHDYYINEVPVVTEELVAKAREKLAGIGLDVEPRLYAVVVLSY